MLNVTFITEDIVFSLLKSSFVWCRLQVANRDLPAAFANRKKIQLQRRQMARFLALELEEKMNPLVEVCYSLTPFFIFCTHCVGSYFRCVHACRQAGEITCSTYN